MRKYLLVFLLLSPLAMDAQWSISGGYLAPANTSRLVRIPVLTGGATSSSVIPSNLLLSYDGVRYNSQFMNRTISFTDTGSSPELAELGAYSHQGVATDGTRIYTFASEKIYKWTASWALVDSNVTPFTDYTQVNHFGDGDYYNGKLYLPAEYWNSCETDSAHYVMVYDTANSMARSSVHALNVPFEVTALTVVPDSNAIYTVSYCDGTKIWKFDLTTFALEDSIVLATTITNPQGIYYKNGYFYISADNGSINVVNGTSVEILYTNTATLGGAHEGLDFSQDYLLWLTDYAIGTSNIVHYLVPSYTAGLTVTPHGFVGIGTNEPLAPFHLSRRMAPRNNVLAGRFPLAIFDGYNGGTGSGYAVSFESHPATADYAGEPERNILWQMWSFDEGSPFGGRVEFKTRRGGGLAGTDNLNTHFIIRQDGTVAVADNITDMSATGRFQVTGYSTLTNLLELNSVTNTRKFTVDSSGGVDGNAYFADTSAFSGSATRLAIYLPGVTSADKYIAQGRVLAGPGNEALPVAGDNMYCAAKADSLIILRQAGTTSGLKVQYIRAR